MIVEESWAALGYLAAGCPKSVQAYRARLGPYRSTVRHSVAFVMLVEDVRRACCLRPQLALAKGRGTARLHRLAEMLRSVSPLENELSNIQVHSSDTVALPVSVSEVQKRIPENCGSCFPEDYLEGQCLDVFQSQSRLVASEAPFGETVPKHCYMVDPSCERDLRRVLLQKGFHFDP